MLDVALVGTGGMLPLANRYLTSLLCRYNGKMVLIDCGEGTQMSLRLLGFGFKNIDVICLTHFHADHTAGLAGLLLTIGGSGRLAPVTIIGPKGVEYIVKSICVIAPEVPFELKFVELLEDGVSKLMLSSFCISATPVVHNCPCYAYSLAIKRAGKFDIVAAESLGIPKNLWGLLQKGQDIEYNDRVYTPPMVMGGNRKGLKISYCTDSRPPRHLPEFIYESDIFICEGHYGDNMLLEKAKSHRHMIYSEAAQLAKNGKVKELWLTHFSPAMTEPSEYIKNASDIFENTIIGYDRMCKSLTFKE